MKLIVLKDSEVCKNGLFCTKCRSLNAGRAWRNSLIKSYDVPNNEINFECPSGKEWINDEVKKKVNPTILRENRPAVPSFSQVKTAIKAITTGTKVSLEVMQERDEICKQCDKQRIDNNGVRWCSICGCATSGENKKILNLTAYEENLPHWGCKHPKRNEGKGWPK